jgi:hypothetical protein
MVATKAKSVAVKVLEVSFGTLQSAGRLDGEGYLTFGLESLRYESEKLLFADLQKLYYFSDDAKPFLFNAANSSVYEGKITVSRDGSVPVLKLGECEIPLAHDGSAVSAGNGVAKVAIGEKKVYENGVEVKKRVVYCTFSRTVDGTILKNTVEVSLQPDANPDEVESLLDSGDFGDLLPLLKPLGGGGSGLHPGIEELAKSLHRSGVTSFKKMSLKVTGIEEKEVKFQKDGKPQVLRFVVVSLAEESRPSECLIRWKVDGNYQTFKIDKPKGFEFPARSPVYVSYMSNKGMFDEAIASGTCAVELKSYNAKNPEGLPNCILIEDADTFSCDFSGIDLSEYSALPGKEAEQETPKPVSATVDEVSEDEIPY